jgi:hypothetical protein
LGSIHQRRLKLLQLGLGLQQSQCQLRSWKLNNNTPDGARTYAYCPDGEDVTEVDPDWSVDLEFYADWRPGGISDYLMQHDGEQVDFTIDHYPDIPEEHVTWTGKLLIKAPSVGGEVRTTEMTAVTLQIIGKPTFTREEN